MLPDFLTDPHVATSALVPVVADYPVPEAGLLVVRPPGDCVPRKVRVLTDILIETFRPPQVELTQRFLLNVRSCRRALPGPWG
jgi:DNA-binding transcriptional LysR family regulator